MKTKIKIFLTVFLTIFVSAQAFYAIAIDNNNIQEETIIEQQKNYKKVLWYKRSTFKRDLMIVSSFIISLSVINMHTGFFSLHVDLHEALKKEIDALRKYKEDLKKYEEKLKENNRIQQEKAEVDTFLKNNKPEKGKEHECVTCYEEFNAEDVVFFPCICVIKSQKVVCKDCKNKYEEKKRNICMCCGQAYIIEEKCNDLKPSLTSRSLFVSYIAQLFV